MCYCFLYSNSLLFVAFYDILVYGGVLMEQLTIYLIEDDPETCNRFSAAIINKPQIKLIGITNNAIKALDTIYAKTPDVLILDLELHQGGGTGLDILRALHSTPSAHKPYILITTNNSSTITLEFARNLGADFIFSKHQQNYSEESVLDFILMLQPILSSKKESHPEQTGQQILARRKQLISHELLKIGIHPKHLGYTYLIDAILMVIEHPTPNLCTTIGNKYHKSEASIERAMQNAISRAWRVTDIEELLCHYTAKIRSDKGVPTLTEFIYYYANKIREKE